MPPNKKLKSKQDTRDEVQRPLQTLPASLLRGILLESVEQIQVPGGRQQALFGLCGLCKAARSALFSETYASAQLRDVEALVLFNRTIKASSAITRVVRELGISIEDIYSKDMGLKKTSMWKVHSLKHILAACTSIQRLSLVLGPLTATSPFSYLLRDLGSIFKPLNHLTSLSLHASEIWMHDVAAILSVTPSLRSLEIDALVRGDLHTYPLDTEAIRPALEAIKMSKNTLTSQHIRWLLEGQTELRKLELAVPMEGNEAQRSFDAVEKVSEGLKHLAITSSWPAPKSTTTKSSADEQSLILPVLTRAAPSLVSLRLISLFAPPSSLSQIFEFPFDQLQRLEIEDTATSGMRSALQEALGGGGGGGGKGRRGEEWDSDASEDDDDRMDVDGDEKGMPSLKMVVSFGVKRGNLPTSESGKKFGKVCRSRKISWRVE